MQFNPSCIQPAGRIIEINEKFTTGCSFQCFAFQLKLITYKNQCKAPETLLENSVSIIVGDIPIDPATYVQNFGVTMGAYEIRLNSSEYEPERMWLGVDQLRGEVSLPSSQSQSSTTNRTSDLYRCCHHNETIFTNLTDDLTPSYASVVTCIEPSGHHRRSESRKSCIL